MDTSADFPTLSAAFLARTLGQGTASRGVAYQRQKRVTRIAWDPDDLKLTGLVRGTRSRPYSTAVRLRPARQGEDPFSDKWTIVWSTCTCPMGGYCKHVAALLVQAGVESQRAPQGKKTDSVASAAWHRAMQSLPTLGAPPTTDTNPVQIGLQVRIDEGLLRWNFPTGQTLLSLRLVRRGQRGGWVATGMSWKVVSQWPHNQDPSFDPALVECLADLYRTSVYGIRYGDYAAPAWLPLTGTIPSVWDSLDEAVRLGIVLAGERVKDSVEWRSPMDCKLDVAPKDGGVVIRSVLTDDRGEIDIEHIRAIDSTGLMGYTVGPNGNRLVVGRSEHRLDAGTRIALSWNDLTIPARDMPDFQQEFLPRLRRMMVVEAKGGVELPEAVPPILNARVSFDQKRSAWVQWRWVYGSTTCRLDPSDHGEVRDFTAEARIRGEVEQAVGDLMPEWKVSLAWGGAWFEGLQAFDFVTQVLPVLNRLDDVTVEMVDDTPQWNEVESDPLIEIATRPTASTDWFDMDVRVSIEGHEIPIAALLTALVINQDRMMTEDGTVFRLDSPNLAALRELIEEAQELSDRPTALRINRFQASLWSQFEELADVTEQAEAWKAAVSGLADLAHGVAPEPVDLPSGLVAHLRDYQRDGFQWLAFLHTHKLGGILADDMGLGKTVEVLALIQHAVESGQAALESGQAALESGQGAAKSSKAKGKSGKSAKSGKAVKTSKAKSSAVAAEAGAALVESGLAVAESDQVMGQVVEGQVVETGEGAAGSNHPAPFLVVAPASVVSNWADEARRFTPGLRVRTLDSTLKRAGLTADELTNDVDVVAMSYAIFRLDFEQLKEQTWAGLILDEAQFAKNRASKANECARALPAGFKLAVTGTPMENNLTELWAMLAIVAPGLYPSAQAFQEMYTRPISAGAAAAQASQQAKVKLTEQEMREAQAARELGQARLARLRRRMRPLLLRRTKENVAPDLPDRLDNVVPIDLDPKHAKLYSTFLTRERTRMLGLLKDFDANRFTIFSSLTLLRRIALDAGLVDPTYEGVPSAKLDFLFDQLDEVISAGHRALVFSQFTTFLGRVRARCDQRGIAYEYLDGTTTKRAQVISRFKKGDAPVFLISLKAGGVGLNLTEADYVFLLDPWWNPAVEAQAIDRTHRIGQTRTVVVSRLVSKGTIEEKVLALSQSKAELFNAVLDDNGDSFSRALTADDVRALLEDS